MSPAILIVSFVLAVVLGAVIAGAVALLSLGKTRRTGEAWRAKCDALQIECARLDAQVGQLSSIERERQELRERLEYLAAEKSRLEAMAERVPGLERENAALTDQLVRCKAA